MPRLSPSAALIFLVLALAFQARAEEPKSVAVLAFQSNPDGKGQESAVEALVSTELARAPGVRVITQADLKTLLDTERQRQLLGTDTKECTEACMAELAGAAGARYVLSGRVDRFGERYVLLASLFDSQEARVLAKKSVEAEGDAGLPEASERLSRELLASLGLQPSASPGAGRDSERGRISLGLRVGNTFIANLAALNLGGDLELGWRIDPRWVALLQVGVTLVRHQSELLPEQFVILPSVLGIRRLYRTDASFQPYWGLGLGVQLALGNFGPFQKTGPLPTVIGAVGFQYGLTERMSLGLEGTTNVAQMMLGFTEGQRGNGFNLDLNGSVTWRF